MRRAQEVVASDGTQLYYEVSGVLDGPTVVLFDGIGCDGFVWKYLRPELEQTHRVVHPHYRGHGRSGQAPDLSRYGIDLLVEDAEQVMDAVGVESAVLMGHSMGVQVALESALTFSSRVDGLVLLCGSYGRPLDTFHDHSMMRAVLPWAQKFIKHFGTAFKPVLETLAPSEIGWRLATMTEVDGQKMRREDFIPYLRHLGQMDQTVFLHMLEQAAEHTTDGRLGDVDAPTLILGGLRDQFTPVWVSEVMHAQLPNSVLEIIDGTHAAPLEEIEETAEVVTGFLREHDLMPALRKSA